MAFRSHRSAVLLGSLRGRFSAPIATLTIVAFLGTFAPPRTARADSPETAEPADAPNFAEATNGVKGGADEAASTTKATKARKAPVSAKGSFTTSVDIQVPPGRLGMTPSLALSYDSGSVAESAVGAGWSFGTPTVSRSTRQGFPRVVTGADGWRAYDDSAAVFTSPHGELVPASDGPVGVTGVLYAPAREASAVRYEYRSDVLDGMFIEHDPSGKKRYYGLDTCLGTTGRITNELGTHAWLLVREEDSHGNSIQYDYHYAAQAAGRAQAHVTTAQTTPILSRVGWGSNGCAASASPPFTVTTTLDSVKQAGPLNLLDGNTLLEDRISKIDVLIDGAVKWTYTLGYSINGETYKTRLATVQRAGAGEAPETTTFTYSDGAPASGPRFVDMGAIGDPVAVYTNDSRWWESLNPFEPQRESPEQAVQAPGFRAGTKFIDIDGNGTTDAVYHAAGIGTTATHLLWEESSFQTPSPTGLGSWVLPTLGAASEGSVQPSTGLPYFPLFGSWDRADFTSAAMQDLVDLDGDGDPDGIALPLSVDVRPGVGVGLLDPPMPHLDVPPAGQMRFRIQTNTARAGGVQHPSEQLVDNWPPTALVASTVFATRSTVQPGGPLRYTTRPQSELQIPFVDVNADGKADVVLLKHRERRTAWTPGGAVAVPQKSVLRLYGNMDAPDLGEVVEGPLDALIQSTVRNDHAVVLVDDELLKLTSEPNQYVRLWTTAERLKLVELPGATPMLMLSGVGVMPAPGFPTSVPVPPIGPDGEPHFSSPIPAENPWWMIVVDPEGDIWNPLGDLDRAGGGGPAENMLFGEYRFVPRTYLMRGDIARGLVAEPAENASDFETGLQRILNNGSPDECVITDSCLYPPHVNFNAMLVDVNGDGLPDLVSAETPVHTNPAGAGSTTTCARGHRVHLNRGYGFENAPGETFAHTWTSPSGPLDLVANRDRSCDVTRPRIVDDLVAGLPTYPIGTMAQTDINGDGRVDIVLAYQPHITGDAWPPLRATFLNTGRGFAPAPSSFDLPAGVVIASDLPRTNQTISTPAQGAWPRIAVSDQARFVDLDNDGLVDIAVAGTCVRDNVGLTKTCTPAKWYRNAGTLPDRLESVTSTSGAWTTIGYDSPKSDIARFPEGGFHPPATTRLVKTVRSAAGPASPGTGYDPFPVQEIRLSYDNYVKDAVSNEVLGFEKVTAEFVNYFGSEEREHVRVTRMFDVRPEILNVNGDPLPVRHPLKGALVSSVTESGGWTTAEVYEYQVGQLGSGVRVRPRRELHGDTSPSQTTAWTAEETLQWDAFGNPVERVSGNYDGAQVAPPAQLRRTGTEYENHTDTQWMIGLVTRRQKQGYSEDIDGNIDESHVLEDVVNTYDSLGSVASTARVNISDAACAGPADHVTRYDYWPNGLLKASHEAAGPAGAYSRDVNFTYEAMSLYVATAQTSVGKTTLPMPPAPQPTELTPGTTSLTVSFLTDLRHGKTTQVTDPNGAVTKSTYDSRGRILTRTGPDNTVLEQNVYADAFPLSETSTITTDVGKTFQRQTQLDADGHALSVVEGAGTTAVPWSRKSKVRIDGFGRTVESYLPAFVSSLGGGAAPSTGPKVVTTYDGFDRSLQVTTADGRVTSSAYEPRQTSETNARGVVTLRAYDAFGDLLSVNRNATGPAGESSTHSFVRDGRGEILTVTDGDGSVRRIARDGGGRTRFVTLPTAPGAAPTRFSMCHDVGDKLVHLESPAGRVVDLMHDELGRTLVTTATDAAGLSIRNTQIYDQTSQLRGLGRLTRKNDESGSYKFDYDAYGRPSTVTYGASTRAMAGATNVAASYGATFVYAPAGALSSVTFSGVPGAGTTPALTYTRDVKGRATTVSSKVGTTVTALAASVTFDAADRITSARYGNGTSGAWTFNALTERLDKISYLNSSNGVVASVAHIYDENDNPITETRQKQGFSGTYSEKIHRYDALDRLYSSEASFPTGNQYERYSYSPSGNVNAAGGDAYTYASPVTAQAVSLLVNSAAQKQRALGYDEDGYLESDVEDRADGTRTTKTLAFDPIGCMRSITKVDRAANGTSTSSASDYTCGLDGRVVARSTTKVDGSHSRRIDFAGLAEIRPDDGVFMLRVPVQGSVAVEDARSLSTGARVSSLSGYLVSDARGSVLAKTRFDVGTPSFTVEAEYDAWGKRLAGYSTLSAPKHGFAGAEPDEAVGTYSFGARTYDPTLRRWVSPDPLLASVPSLDEHLGDNLNLYAYAGNNPVRRLDLSGFDGNDFTTRFGNLMNGFVQGAGEASVPGGMAFAAATPSMHNAEADLGRRAGHAIGGVCAIFSGMQTVNAAAAVEVGSGGAATLAAGATAVVGAAQILNGGAAVVASITGTGAEKTAPDESASDAKPVPNPWGKAGGPAHQGKVAEVVEDVESRGLEPRKEYKVPTPGGTKSSRFVDVVGRDADGNVVEMHQVGRQTQAGNPVAREIKAMQDIQKATGQVPQFHPYNAK